MRTTLKVMLLVAGFAAWGCAAQAQHAARIYQQYHQSVVSIETASGSGSGLVVDRGGLISTNYHVIEGHRVVSVFLVGDPTPMQGTVVSVDPAHDLALIEVTPRTRLTPVRLGDSSRLSIGAEVIAIGNPLGLDNTVSSGIISQIRRLDELALDGELIQTTAPISPGSSGGGLFDRNGRVIGITTLQAVVGQNLNFAVPVERLKELIASHEGGAMPARSSRRAERPRGGAMERAPGSERLADIRVEHGGGLTQELGRLFDLGLKHTGGGFQRSREERLVVRARRAIERGRHEAALETFVTYSRPIERPELHFFWGVVDVVSSHPTLARKHLKELGNYPTLYTVLEELIERAENW